MGRRRAIGFTPSHTDLGEIVAAARLADELGYEFVCVPEGWALDSTVVLAALATATSRIKLAATIVSIWGRTPATLAMTSATLQELSGGRFVLGLGASTPTLAEGFHDVAFERPVERLREVTSTVRTLLDGGRVPLTTGTTQRPLRLGISASERVPIWLGTVGPRALRVTAELADGWYPSWVSQLSVAALASQLAAWRAELAPTAEPLVVVAGPMVAVDDDLDRARASTGATIAWYLCSMGDLHPRFIASQGYAAQVRAVQEANPRLTPANGVIPPEAAALVDDFSAAGPAELVRESLQRWDEVVDVVTVGMPAAGSPWALVEATIRAGAP
ncbi:MAG: LLM class flavin-dependent oxidoreductase [Acidimicrobiia bacterium]|nr:LLM class flavin-dependent oxidoreductase [Acidimicrobiia bacterium]